ncbi:HNH endonuclease [Pelomyxa schiedti]|nr:HNH endonuclease [Pelomyxa schiedti]
MGVVRLVSVAGVVALVVIVGLRAAEGAMPTPVSATTAKQYLSTLKVEAEHSRDGYDRDLFPHWIKIDGTCDTRETVMKRDGKNVVTDSACAATSGSWYSEYDGETWTLASDLDIDHVVPLAEAWDSGADTWTTAQRQNFANDLTRPQLIAVTDNVNQSKGDQDPATWWPPRTSYKCTYARAWVQVKYYYGLSVDSAEKTALNNQLAGC